MKPWFEAAVDDWELEARRLRMRHDNQFYGPMKNAKCGCEECKWAQRFLDLFKAAISQPGEPT